MTRHSISKGIKGALGRFAGAAGLYASNFSSKMVVVAFHRVNDNVPEDGLTCTSARFEEFCAFFQRYFRIVPLSEQIRGCRERRDMGGTLSITFDDGYLDNYEVAAPVLCKLGLPATYFVVSGFIGTDFVPPWDNHLKPKLAWMNWDQVRGLRDLGFDIGAHTHSHINMGRESQQVISKELALCQETLERELGFRPRLFAYPFGGRSNISPLALSLVKAAGYECCLAAYGGVNPRVSDPFSINRIGIAEWFASPHQFGFEVIAGRA